MECDGSWVFLEVQSPGSLSRDDVPGPPIQPFHATGGRAQRFIPILTLLGPWVEAPQPLSSSAVPPSPPGPGKGYGRLSACPSFLVPRFQQLFGASCGFPGLAVRASHGVLRSRPLWSMGRNVASTILLSLLIRNNSELGGCLAHVVLVVR